MIEFRIRVDTLGQLDEVFPEGFLAPVDLEVYAGDLVATIDLCAPIDDDTDDTEPEPLNHDDTDTVEDPLPEVWRPEANRRPYDTEPAPRTTRPLITSLGWTDDQLDAAILDVLRDGPATYSEIIDVLEADLDDIKDRMRHLADIRKVETAGVKGWKVRRRNFDAEAARFAAAEAL